jgi:nucleotide-binding universal stress UspA family protein
MYARILVPLDGTPLAETVLPHATEIARRFDSTLVLLRVSMSIADAARATRPSELPAAVPLAEDVIESLVDSQEQLAEAYLKLMSTSLAKAGIAHECVVMEGDPELALVQAVREQRIELVTMATHARTGLGRLLHGSIADRLLHDIEVPILMLHAHLDK